LCKPGGDPSGAIWSGIQWVRTLPTMPILRNAKVPCYACAPGRGMGQYLHEIGFVEIQIAPGYENVGMVDQFEVYVQR
jgi:hypothetical protein